MWLLKKIKISSLEIIAREIYFLSRRQEGISNFWSNLKLLSINMTIFFTFCFTREEKDISFLNLFDNRFKIKNFFVEYFSSHCSFLEKNLNFFFLLTGKNIACFERRAIFYQFAENVPFIIRYTYEERFRMFF